MTTMLEMRRRPTEVIITPSRLRNASPKTHTHADGKEHVHES